MLPQTSPLAVVLIEPRIPQNTGNIARLCVCAGVELFLVGELGFRLSDKFLERAGMDYLEHLHIQHRPSFTALLEEKPGWTAVYTSSKATRSHTQVTYPPNTLLVFGREDKGLPESFVKANPDTTVRIPMAPQGRSLNLSNSVAIVLYEALRQLSL